MCCCNCRVVSSVTVGNCRLLQPATPNYTNSSQLAQGTVTYAIPPSDKTYPFSLPKLVQQVSQRRSFLFRGSKANGQVKKEEIMFVRSTRDGTGHVTPVRPIAGLVSTRQASRAYGSIKYVVRTAKIAVTHGVGERGINIPRWLNSEILSE